uniref:Uncharacterized protein n=1 Tax=Rhizophora mucronata TaxID=61149 RepID=A0A2P2P8H8_RHIMU
MYVLLIALPRKFLGVLLHLSTFLVTLENKCLLDYSLSTWLLNFN